MNPWTGFALYAAGGVYCHEIATAGPARLTSESNMEFILMSLNALGNLHPSLRPFTKQLHAQFRAAKVTLRGRNAAVASPSSHAYDPTYNRLPNMSKISAALDLEDSDSKLSTSSTSPSTPFESPLAGILVEADRSAKNHPWRPAADHKNDRAFTGVQTGSTDPTPHVMSSQLDAAQFSPAPDLPAHVGWFTGGPAFY